MKKDISKIGVLFDLDGVLIDSESSYTVFWSAIGRKYFPSLPNFAYDIKGTNLTRILSMFAENEREQVKQAIHDFESTMRYPMFEGVSEFLDALAEAQIPTAIVTSSDDVKMQHLYKQHPGFDRRFTAVIDGTMVKRSKPDPEGYLLAARTIGRDIADCYVFEDSLQGLEAGMRAGATVIGVATTNPTEVLKDKAHKLIEGFTGFGVDDMLSVSKP